MTRYIEQFMWGYQHYFRHDLEYQASLALSQIGVAAAPRAVLVGFATHETTSHNICIEPGHGWFTQVDFESVNHRADEMFALDDDRNIIVTGSGQQERFERGSLDKSRRAAIAEAILRTEVAGERSFWVGASAIVGAFRVYPVLSVLRSRWDTVPLLPEVEDSGRTRVPRSFPNELMHRLLALASLSLSNGHAPQRLIAVGSSAAAEVVHASASDFLDSIPLRIGQMPSDLLDSLDRLAAAPYEGRPSSGSLVFLPVRTEPTLALTFQRPVRLARTRQARKVLEMSGSNRLLVSDGTSLLGIASDDAAPTGSFRVDFFKRATWVLSAGGVELVRSEFGRPALPRPPLDRELFVDNFERIFARDSSADSGAVWDLVELASRQGHGTMLVVHRDAAHEGVRLGEQALPVGARALGAEALAAATRIDGAILVAPDGTCHAVGVILDGPAGESGDPGRGARFNSASRYADYFRDDCLILVVSDDGSTEIVPEPRRRLSRVLIADVVAAVLEASEDEVDFEHFHRMFDRAEAHVFYLSAEQCAVLNAARQRVEEVRWAESQMRLYPAELVANRWMNDSYFLD